MHSGIEGCQGKERCLVTQNCKSKLCKVTFVRFQGFGPVAVRESREVACGRGDEIKDAGLVLSGCAGGVTGASDRTPISFRIALSSTWRQVPAAEELVANR